jgi:rhodanese-related sulfurtransferase
VEKIDADTLRNWLETPDIFILDLRNQAAWEGSDSKIRGAHRFDPQRMAEWSGNLPRDRRLVLY